MFCSNCGNKTLDGAQFCNNCGKKVSRNTGKDSEKIIENKPQASFATDKDYDFLYIPVSRLIWVTILSLGFYPVYWFVANWSAIKKVTGKKIDPFWRGIFSPFFSGDPFELALKQGKKHGYQYSYNSSVLSVIYFVSLILSRGIDKVISVETLGLFFYILVEIVSLLIILFPLIKVQNVTNWYSKKSGKSYQKIGLPEYGLIAMAWGFAILIAIFSGS